MEKEIIKKHIDSSLALLYDNDLYLFSNRVNERTITGKLAYYLNLYIQDYDIDCEYNRNKDKPKYVNGDIHNPDIIMHRRGSNDYNILWCECKPYRNTRNENDDIETIKGSMIGELNYNFGLYINFGEILTNCKIILFSKNYEGIIEEDLSRSV